MTKTEKAAREFLEEADVQQFRALFSEASPSLKSCVDNALIAAFASGAAYATRRCDAEHHH